MTTALHRPCRKAQSYLMSRINLTTQKICPHPLLLLLLRARERESTALFFLPFLFLFDRVHDSTHRIDDDDVRHDYYYIIIKAFPRDSARLLKNGNQYYSAAAVLCSLSLSFAVLLLLQQLLLAVKDEEPLSWLSARNRDSTTTLNTIIKHGNSSTTPRIERERVDALD